jgi:hypothetical protein
MALSLGETPITMQNLPLGLAAAVAAKAEIVATSMSDDASLLVRASLLSQRLYDPDTSRPLCSACVLHQDLGLQAFKVAEDRSNSTYSAIALEAENAVFGHDVAFNHDLVPCLRITHIVDWNIVMLAPEKRHSGEGYGVAQHIESRGLSLALGDDPVLNADVFA